MKYFMTALALLAAAQATAQQQISQPGFLRHPESVVSDGHYYYVSDIGKELQPLEKDGDGCIWKIGPDGKPVGDTAWVKGLNAPKGVTIVGDVLYTADLDRVRGFRLSTGAQAFDMSFASEKTGFLNDVTSGGDNRLFVSATDLGKIFVIDPEHPSYYELPMKEPVPGANGICYAPQQKRLYLCTFAGETTPEGQIGYLDLSQAQPAFQKLTERKGFYDGIALLDKGTLVVSDWVGFGKTGQLLRVQVANGKVTVLNHQPISGSADLSIGKPFEILVPVMLEGQLLRYNIGR